MHIDELQRRLNIGEDEDTEFKSAEGGLPKSLWETLSAFANTSGGYIIFGIAEKGDNVEIHGIRKPDALIKNFRDAHNDLQKLSVPVCSEADVKRVPIVALPMISMIPEQIEKELKGLVGDTYPSLTELDRITLVLAHRFGDISNSDIRHYRKDHPREIGDRLKFLVERGWLMKTGHGRGSRYRLSKGEPSRDLFSVSSEHYVQSSEHYITDSEHYKELVKIATPVRDKGRAPKSLVRQIILKICVEDYVQLRTLADLLKRDVNSIRNHYVNPMVVEGLLELRYPFQPNHPSQAYKTVDGNAHKETI